MRERVRSILTWILTAVVSVILVAVAAEWFIEVAKDKGLYDHAGRRFDLVMGVVRDIATSGLVLYPLATFAGVVGGMWLDVLLKRREQSLSIDWEYLDAEISSMSELLKGLIDNPDATRSQQFDAIYGVYAICSYIDARLDPAIRLSSILETEEQTDGFQGFRDLLSGIAPAVRLRDPRGLEISGGNVIIYRKSLLTAIQQTSGTEEETPQKIPLG